MKHGFGSKDAITSCRARFGKKELSVITAYITLLFVYSVGERISFTKTMWDNLSISLFRLLPFQPRFRDFVLLLGIPVLIYMVYLIRRSFFCMDTVFIMGYALILICTAIFDPELDTGHNLWMTLFTMLPVFICYYASRLLDSDGWKHLLYISIRVSAYIWGIGCGVSLIQFFIGYTDSYPFGLVQNAVTPQGVSGGRLFGVFADPNYASIISILMILGIIYLMREFYVHKAEKILLWTCMVLNVLYIALAFSRSAFLAILALMFVFSIYCTVLIADKIDCGEYQARNRFISGLFGCSKSHLRIILISIVLFVLSVLLAVVLYLIIKHVCEFIVGLYMPESSSLAVRIYDGSDDYSGGRFEIWADYIEALFDRPLFGFSADGTLGYIRDNYPWTSVAIWSRAHTHNTYVQILSQGGIVGFAMMFSVMALPNIRFINLVFIKRTLDHPRHIYLFFMICVTVLVSGVAYSSGFTQIRIEADMLWLALGGLFVYTKN